MKLTSSLFTTKIVEEELIDGLCCYSAVNQGQLNKEIE